MKNRWIIINTWNIRMNFTCQVCEGYNLKPRRTFAGKHAEQHKLPQLALFSTTLPAYKGKSFWPCGDWNLGLPGKRKLCLQTQTANTTLICQMIFTLSQKQNAKMSLGPGQSPSLWPLCSLFHKHLVCQYLSPPSLASTCGLRNCNHSRCQRLLDHTSEEMLHLGRFWTGYHRLYVPNSAWL